MVKGNEKKENLKKSKFYHNRKYPYKIEKNVYFVYSTSFRFWITLYQIFVSIDYFDLIESTMLSTDEVLMKKIKEAYEEIKKLIENKKFKELAKIFK